MSTSPSQASRPEVWLRGPVVGYPALLQPVAHSLLQAREEVEGLLPAVSNAELWATPGGAASAGFHARHGAGSLDRLFTYARGETLSEAQREALAAEGEPDLAPGAATRLLAHVEAVIDRALAQLRGTDEEALLEAREVGRARLPATMLGLLFHGAEHMQRHVGQLATTVRLVRATGAAGS